MFSQRKPSYSIRIVFHKLLFALGEQIQDTLHPKYEESRLLEEAVFDLHSNRYRVIHTYSG